jgi:pimeloyl-ACP methyl ester carboxylesterase
MKPVKPAELPPPLSDTQAQMPIPTSPESNDTMDDTARIETISQEAIQPGSALKAVFTNQTIEEMLAKATDPENSDYEKLKAEAIKADTKAIHISAEGFTNISTFRDLMTVTAPVCALLGENDSFLPRPADSLLNQLDERQDLKLLEMANARHFPMLDDKAQFVRLLKDFLEAPEVATLEMKEEWRRRKR